MMRSKTQTSVLRQSTRRRPFFIFTLTLCQSAWNVYAEWYNTECIKHHTTHVEKASIYFSFINQSLNQLDLSLLKLIFRFYNWNFGSALVRSKFLFSVWLMPLFFLRPDIIPVRKSKNSRFSSVHHQPRLEFWENGHRWPGQGVFRHLPPCLCIARLPARHRGTDGWVSTRCLHPFIAHSLTSVSCMPSQCSRAHSHALKKNSMI